jgi:hypothetical protein
MKMLKTTSPYTKMYLVTPKVYEQVLSCLDEKDKKMTEDLNVDKDTIEERPSEKYIDMLNQEQLNPIESEMIESPPTLPPVNVTDEFVPERNLPETEMFQEKTEKERDMVPNLETETQMVQDDIPLTGLKRQKKLDYLAGRIKFNPQDGKVFTCKICLKTFDRNWGLIRHMTTVHKNIPKTVLEEGRVIEKPFETNIPAMLNIQSKNIVPNDDDVRMIEENPLKKPCSISANTSNRVIPKPQIYFKPPRNREMIVPAIKKRMMLKDNTPKQKTKKNEQNVASDDLMSFDNWPEEKKPLARTSTEANFKNKPPKSRKNENFQSWA